MAKILIVEDDRRTAEVIARELKSRGHSCAIIIGGRGAHAAARKARPDLLVLDVMMADMSGFEVCRSIRRDPELFTTPIVIVSAMNEPEEVEHGLAQGADDFITKPFEVHNLVQRIDGLVKSSSKVSHRDELTELADAEQTRREIVRRLTSNETFSLVYIELMNLRSFAQRAGVQARDKAMRHLARAVDQCRPLAKAADAFIGHMGGGCFIAVLPVGAARDYCRILREVWGNHLSEFYEAVKLSAHSENEEKASADVPLDLLCCITTRRDKESITVKQMLETISRIRNARLRGAEGGVFVDRRH